MGIVLLIHSNSNRILCREVCKNVLTGQICVIIPYAAFCGVLLTVPRLVLLLLSLLVVVVVVVVLLLLLLVVVVVVVVLLLLPMWLLSLCSNIIVIITVVDLSVIIMITDNSYCLRRVSPCPSWDKCEVLLGIQLLGGTFWCGLSNHQAATAQMGTGQAAEFSPRISKYPRAPNIWHTAMWYPVSEINMYIAMISGVRQ